MCFKEFETLVSAAQKACSPINWIRESFKQLRFNQLMRLAGNQRRVHVGSFSNIGGASGTSVLDELDHDNAVGVDAAMCLAA